MVRPRRRHRLWDFVLNELDRLVIDAVTAGVLWAPGGFVTPGPGLAEIRATLTEDAAARRCVREAERYLAEANAPPTAS